MTEPKQCCVDYMNWYAEQTVTENARKTRLLERAAKLLGLRQFQGDGGLMITANWIEARDQWLRDFEEKIQ